MGIERWDILNEAGRPTGRTVVRGNVSFRPGEYHLVVHIWIISSRGRFLIQRRADDKKLMPGEWAATGGAAVAGEDSYTAAARELYEELGIKSDLDSLMWLTRIKKRNSLLDVWVITSDIDEDSLTLQKSEVAEAKWVTRAELEKMIENGNFHNYGWEYFDNIFEKIEDHRGATV